MPKACPEFCFFCCSSSPLHIQYCFKLYIHFIFIIFYWVCYYSSLYFPPLLPSTQYPPHSHRQSPHHCSCPWVMHVSIWLLHFLYCTLHPHGYSVTSSLYFLIPSPLHPFSPPPSHLTTIKMLSVSVILSLFLLFV